MRLFSLGAECSQPLARTTTGTSPPFLRPLTLLLPSHGRGDAEEAHSHYDNKASPSMTFTASTCPRSSLGILQGKQANVQGKQDMHGINGRNVQEINCRNLQEINGRNVQEINGRGGQEIHGRNVQEINGRSVQEIHGRNAQEIMFRNVHGSVLDGAQRKPPILPTIVTQPACEDIDVNNAQQPEVLRQSSCDESTESTTIGQEVGELEKKLNPL